MKLFISSSSPLSKKESSVQTGKIKPVVGCLYWMKTVKQT